MEKARVMERFFRNETLTKLYADGDRPLVLRLIVENIKDINIK